MVVVVQFLAADHDAPGHQIGRCVHRFKVAVAPVVAHAVDHASGPERNPQHLHGPDREADAAKQQHVEDQHQAHTLPRKARIDVALHPVVGRAVAELLERVFVLRLGAIQLRAAPHHRVQAARLRAVRIVFGLALGVVLAVDGHPLLGLHAGADPQPEAEEMRGNRAQIQRAVRLRTVQKNRHRRNRDVGGEQGVQHDLPPGQIPHAVGQPVNDGAQYGPIR
ncbi:hypothetical protein SDC9_160092 [bioreactor metagenome]|uniref:Uncharacterized protein n=1 Tax=bioreactor metagenome TaxID=1076179 RepID=A0A645FGZ5_9ZZZZ